MAWSIAPTMCWWRIHCLAPCRGVLKNAPWAGRHFGFGFGFGLPRSWAPVVVPCFDPEPVVAWLGTVDSDVNARATTTPAIQTNRRFTVRCPF